MFTACLISTLLLVSSAPERSTKARLDRATALEGDLEYERAAEELLLVITDPRATEDQLIEANLLAGIVKRVLGNHTESRLHFLYVLKRRPETQLDPTRSPKIRTFFELVREEVTGGNLSNASPLPSQEADEEKPTPLSAPPDEAGSLIRPRLVEGAGTSVDEDEASPAPATQGSTEVAPLPESSSSALPSLLGGGVLAAAGIGIVVLSTSAALVVDGLFFDASRSADQRDTLRFMSRALVATAVTGGVAAAGGAGLMMLGVAE